LSGAWKKEWVPVPRKAGVPIGVVNKALIG